MARHNIGSLVVLKPGEGQQIAGMFTERGGDKYLFPSYFILIAAYFADVAIVD